MTVNIPHIQALHGQPIPFRRYLRIRALQTLVLLSITEKRSRRKNKTIRLAEIAFFACQRVKTPCANPPRTALDC